MFKIYLFFFLCETKIYEKVSNNKKKEGGNEKRLKCNLIEKKKVTNCHREK